MASAEPANDVRVNGGQKPMLASERAKQEAEARGEKPPAKAQYFPLSYKEGLSQWWAGLSPAVTEHKVLSFMPFVKQPPTHTHTGTKAAGANGDAEMSVDDSSDHDAKPVRTNSGSDPYGPRVWHSNLVQLSGKNRYLNEFSVERTGEEGEQNSLVMLHGYGAGLGFFYKNFEHLSRLSHWKLYALDLLGMGRSSRPPFRIHAKDKEAKVREAENWFIDALEEWRIKRGIEKMTLLGHSLGGYMAVCYALKYPGHLNKLILASPVGVPEDPYAVSEEMPDESGKGAAAADNVRKRPYSKWLTTLWDANISPFSLVRLSGPLGPRLVSGWTSRRFGHLPQEESQALHDYSYSLFRQRGSGEYALAYILAPGAFARSPLIRRVQGVGRQYLTPHSAPNPDHAPSNGPPAQGQVEGTLRVRETGIPVVFMYGDKDWMDKKGGYDSQAILEAEAKKAQANATEVERRLENGSVKVRVIKNAGHHLYLEGDAEFNRIMEQEMKDVEIRQRRLAGAGH